MAEKTILIADDDQAILDLFDEMLRFEGYKVFMASNGKEAVEVVRNNPIDLAILDIRMPVMNGLEALQKIREIDRTLEVLIITGYADIENFREAIFSQGAFDYLLKPFLLPEILHTIQNALVKREYLLTKDSIHEELQRHLLQTEKDFSERTRQLRESQIQYKQIIENCNDMIFVIQRGRVKFANPRAAELTGYTHSEITKIPALVLVHPEDRARVAEMHGQRLRGKGVPLIHAFRIMNKKGESFWVEENAIRTVWEEGPAVLEFIRDVSEWKRDEEALRNAYNELKEMQEKLIESEKFAALGRFSAGIAHETKNPLGIILGGIEFLGKNLKAPDEQMGTVLRKIKEATLRADHILMGLLKFAKPSQLAVERINMDQLIVDTLSLFKFKAPLKNITIRTQASNEALCVQADKNQMQQVLLNLLSNAVEAMPKGGDILIRSYKRSICEHLSGRPACVLDVIDKGEGISKEDLPKIFEPFFTTKWESRGTGLGLSISKKIVDKHHGHLVVNSKPGEGTEVKLILPLDVGGAA